MPSSSASSTRAGRAGLPAGASPRAPAVWNTGGGPGEVTTMSNDAPGFANSGTLADT